jgi:hypothetical protein
MAQAWVLTVWDREVGHEPNVTVLGVYSTKERMEEALGLVEDDRALVVEAYGPYEVDAGPNEGASAQLCGHLNQESPWDPSP